MLTTVVSLTSIWVHMIENGRIGNTVIRSYISCLMLWGDQFAVLARCYNRAEKYLTFDNFSCWHLSIGLFLNGSTIVEKLGIDVIQLSLFQWWNSHILDNKKNIMAAEELTGTKMTNMWQSEELSNSNILFVKNRVMWPAKYYSWQHPQNKSHWINSAA